MRNMLSPEEALTGAIPVVEGLFDDLDGDVALIGSKCESCETYYFPQSFCSNPACDSTATSDARIGRKGTIYSYTIQMYQPPDLFIMNPWEPYAIGLVEIPEGLRILAMLSGFDLAAIEIGSEVGLITEPLGRDETGSEILTYKYKSTATREVAV